MKPSASDGISAICQHVENPPHPTDHEQLSIIFTKSKTAFTLSRLASVIGEYLAKNGDCQLFVEAYRFNNKQRFSPVCFCQPTANLRQSLLNHDP